MKQNGISFVAFKSVEMTFKNSTAVSPLRDNVSVVLNNPQTLLENIIRINGT